MAGMFDRETMRQRYWAAVQEKQALEDDLAPTVAQREALLEQIRPLQDQLDQVNATIRDARAPIYDLSVEMGSIAKFLTDADGKARLGEPDA